MTDPRAHPPGGAIERALQDLGTAITFPSTPALAGRVEADLAGRMPSIGWQRYWPRRSPWVVAAAGLLLLLVGSAVLLALPGSRAAIAEWLGLRGVSIEYEPDAPSPSGSDWRLGRQVSLVEAQQQAGFSVLLPGPPLPPEPDAVYIDTLPGGRLISLVYAAGPTLPESPHTGVGLLITQFRGNLNAGLLRKGLPRAARLEQVAVNGTTGFWIEGAPHTLRLVGAGESLVELPGRLAGNTLLWTRGEVTLRLESMLERDEAIRIAETLR